MEKKDLDCVNNEDWVVEAFGEYWANELNKIVDDFFEKEDKILKELNKKKTNFKISNI